MDKNHTHHDGQGLEVRELSPEPKDDAFASCVSVRGGSGRPIVSIVMPVHNQERVLRETLDSIAQQTFRDYELICVDDGSADASLDIEREYAERDERIRLFQREQQGAALERNFGLSKAVGTFVIFLDSDDLFVPHFLEKMVDALERTGADVCMCGYSSFYTGTDEQMPAARLFRGFKQGTYNRRVFGEDTFQVGGACAWNKMYRRDFILECGAVFQDVRCCNDTLFTAKAMWNAKTVYLIDESLVLYRLGLGTSIQDNRLRYSIDSACVAEEMYDQLFDARTFSADETLSLQRKCASLLVLAVDDAAYTGKLDEQLHKRAMADLRKWGVLDIPVIRMGGKKLSLDLWLIKHSDCDGITWAYKHWGLSRGGQRSTMQKAKLGFRIVAAVTAGQAKRFASSVAKHHRS